MNRLDKYLNEKRKIEATISQIQKNYPVLAEANLGSCWARMSPDVDYLYLSAKHSPGFISMPVGEAKQLYQYLRSMFEEVSE